MALSAVEMTSFPFLQRLSTASDVQETSRGGEIDSKAAINGVTAAGLLVNMSTILSSSMDTASQVAGRG